ncbi:histone family protein [Methanospirillum stamsii]|uniref:Transcription factor CBF/NF-Y/archaeal histone domain-containing protein n=1 Tax=Methanospirillum stamsii TaxID=1277351 RepID=A0A2V2MRE4_9EURY|nr:histone [Methanospirillum stamsii]PWR70804.1 hypothetical protein DLD82_15035 [Methanospirillum stamsii]
MVSKTVPKTASKKPGKLAVKAKQSTSKKAAPVKPKTSVRATDLPIAAVVRIAKANGAERVGSDGAELIVQMTEAYLGRLTKEANKMASHGGRKTIKEEDVELASQNI